MPRKSASPSLTAPAGAASASSIEQDGPADAGLQGLRYEEALAELETLVAQMEAGHLPIDDLLAHYRRGAQLLNFCRTRLTEVEAQVKVLEDGELTPWRGGSR